MLHQIDTFGDVAAEQDSVLDYFIKTDAVDRILAKQVSIVLGRKGSGKTALVKYFSSGSAGNKHIAASLRSYPWQLHALRKARGASDIEAHVSSWRYVIAVEALKALLSAARFTINTDSKAAGTKFLIDNYGAVDPKLTDLLRPKKLVLSKATFAPSYLGTAIGSVDIESKDDSSVGPELEALTDCILESCKVIASQEGVPQLFIHIDELDQGLSNLSEERERLLVGLILATRSIRDDERYRDFLVPICYMRTDIWDQMYFSDMNKIKRSTALRLEWDDNSLLRVLEARISKRLGKSSTLLELEDGKKIRGRQSKWSHVVSRTFMRPRDIIQFFNSALEAAKKRDPRVEKFVNQDVVNAREDYSSYLKDELDDEIKPHWRDWEDGLQAISAISKMSFTREEFIRAYSANKSRNNKLDETEALDRLYEFSVIGYRGGIGTGGSTWVYRYLKPQLRFDAGASQFKVHPGLKEYASLQEERR